MQSGKERNVQLGHSLFSYIHRRRDKGLDKIRGERWYNFQSIAKSFFTFSGRLSTGLLNARNLIVYLVSFERLNFVKLHIIATDQSNFIDFESRMF